MTWAARILEEVDVRRIVVALWQEEVRVFAALRSTCGVCKRGCIGVFKGLGTPGFKGFRDPGVERVWEPRGSKGLGTPGLIGFRNPLVERV